MKVVLLGTNGYGPSDDGETACCMLPELGIVFDAGSGLYRLSDYLQTPSLNIYLSHAHMDHIIGLTYLTGILLKKQLHDAELRHEEARFEDLLQRAESYMNYITISSTAGVLEGLQKQFGTWSDSTYNALEGDQTVLGGGVLTYFPVKHTSECIGFRLDFAGHSLAYVTDTIADPELPYVEKIRGVDVLLHDCYLPDKWKDFAQQTGHSHTTAAAQVAARAQVGRLFLIHHNTLERIGDAELASARSIFPATEIGLDKMEIEF